MTTTTRPKSVQYPVRWDRADLALLREAARRLDLTVAQLIRAGSLTLARRTLDTETAP